MTRSPWPAGALAGYRADTAAGKDALLLCDTTEMFDALNQRLHNDTVAADAPTITAAWGHRIAAADLILTCHNDARSRCATQKTPQQRTLRCATANAGR